MIFDSNGIVYATTRVKQESWNPESLIVLSPKHPLTSLILRSVHEVSHRGVMYTVSRSRIFYWIPQAAKLLRKIKKNCFKCRIKDAEATEVYIFQMEQVYFPKFFFAHAKMQT